MNYSEAAYFDNNACQHVAEWHDRRANAARLKRCAKLYEGIERRRNTRAN